MKKKFILVSMVYIIPAYFILLFSTIFSPDQVPEPFKLLLPCSQALANPFTTAPQKKQIALPSPVKTGLLIKIVLWQQQLREKMSCLIKQAKTKQSFVPILLLLGTAFLYGAIHSAGPGHGKAIALSYILSFNPGLIQGLLFANILAFTHGLSGIFLVLTVKFILQGSMTASLAAVTHTTQIISFFFITALGLFLFFKSIYKWISTDRIQKSSTGSVPSFLTAIAVGIIPCPGVVMVMLFAISMEQIFLGIFLGLAISFGMAATLSCVVLLGITGKTKLISRLSGHTKHLQNIEHVIETLASLLVALLGALLLLAFL